ncbi:lysophospholipid acyltransferase family protein [Marinilabiliaceae bacterium ANBcel2]|nr:lysophospholipid acyltransferase family protein [Marinilabiliaceae bacterium ANBcel2]
MSKASVLPWYYWLYQPYKWLVFIPLMVVNSIVFAVLAALCAIFVSSRCGNSVGALWARVTCWITPVKVGVKGVENIKKSKSYVIVANHQTGFDIFMLYAYLPIDFRWLMKKELRNIPFIGFASEKVGHIFIDKRSALTAINSLNHAKDKLVNGTSVFIFPEGSRTWDYRMKSFKKGAFRLALDLELDILPVTIVDSYKIKRRGSFNIVPGSAGLIIHPEIKTSKYKNNIDELMHYTRDVISGEIVNRID